MLQALRDSRTELRPPQSERDQIKNNRPTSFGLRRSRRSLDGLEGCSAVHRFALALCIVALSAGACARRARVLEVPPEGYDCRVQCTDQWTPCYRACTSQSCAADCQRNETHCMEQCPGAHWLDWTPPHTPATPDATPTYAPLPPKMLQP